MPAACWLKNREAQRPIRPSSSGQLYTPSDNGIAWSTAIFYSAYCTHVGWERERISGTAEGLIIQQTWNPVSRKEFQVKCAWQIDEWTHAYLSCMHSASNCKAGNVLLPYTVYIVKSRRDWLLRSLEQPFSPLSWYECFLLVVVWFTMHVGSDATCI